MLDAASPALMRRWAADGSLPVLERLFRRARVARTLGPEGLYVGATWPTFYMGLDPSFHGIYWLDRIVPGTYRRQRCTMADFRSHPALWDVLGAHGRRALVLDVPLTGVSPHMDGVQLVEWGVHDEIFGFRTRPRGLRHRILAGIGRHPVPSSCDAEHRTVEEYVTFADALVRGAQARARLTLDLMAREHWDFLIQVFSECHCAGHQLWHLHDRGHPGFSATTTEAVGDLVQRVYQGVDSALGEIVAALPEDTLVVVATLHGMAHACGASLLLDQVLSRLGALDGEASSAGRTRTGALERLRSTYRRLPARVRRPLYDLRQVANQSVLKRGSPIGPDPKRLRAFHVGLGTGSPWSGIRLNLRGREPAGLVEPGGKADDFVADLIEGLTEIVEVDTGIPIVRSVRKSADLFAGPRLESLPDLLVEWNTDHHLGSAVLGDGAGAVCRISSPRIGELEAVNTYCRGGEHRREGLLLAAGHGIEAGTIDRPLMTIDLAPTFAAVLGCAMPTSGGTVVPELLPLGRSESQPR